MQSLARELLQVVARTLPGLLALSEAECERAAPGKWSRKEILGHLVDSASNNHQRFVRACFSDDLVFEVHLAADVTDPWTSEDWGGNGFSLQFVHVYVDTDGKRRKGERKGVPGAWIEFVFE